MLKRFLLLFCLCALGLAACTKKGNRGCSINGACTAEFRSVGVRFVDKDGNTIEVKNITVTNLRTNTAVVSGNGIDPGFSPDFHTIATDTNKGDFSTEGDDIKITAVSVATNKTTSAMLKLSGGCNCHISKLSGPDKIVFE